MRVEPIDDPGAEWDDFVSTTPGATLGHASAWARILRVAYGLAPCYLAARRTGGELVGVLPLVHFRCLDRHRELVSLPFLDTGGILAREPEAEVALLDAAQRLAEETGARAVELRQLEALSAAPAPPAVDRVDLVLPLESDEQAQWKTLRAKVRNQTRKAERSGLDLASGSPRELCQSFFAPFRVNMRDLGSPVHAERFFLAAAEAFGDRLRFVVARLGDRPVGGLVAIDHGGVVTVPWASTLRSERARCPNNLIYWEALRWAVGQGAREFDFGRSPRDSGGHVFKRGWGAVDRPLLWTRLAPDGVLLTPEGADENATLRHLSSVWSRLPVSLATALGPWIRRRLSN